MRSSKTFIAAVAVTCLVAAACSDDDEESSSETSSAEEPSAEGLDGLMTKEARRPRRGSADLDTNVTAPSFRHRRRRTA